MTLFCALVAVFAFGPVVACLLMRGAHLNDDT